MIIMFSIMELPKHDSDVVVYFVMYSVYYADVSVV